MGRKLNHRFRAASVMLMNSNIELLIHAIRHAGVVMKLKLPMRTEIVLVSVTYYGVTTEESFEGIVTPVVQKLNLVSSYHEYFIKLQYHILRTKIEQPTSSSYYSAI